jgi:tRNA threonylcarbamoyladenosine modification (KEOPS) complex Cgi121 subunit
MRRRISRAEYDTIRANCAARIKLRMEQLNLTPSQVQKLSGDAVFKQEQTAYVTMQELASWRVARQLPKDAKLLALAAVLQDKPESFVPKEHQHGRSLVARKVSQSMDDANGAFHLKVTPSEATPGHAYVEARILLPTAKAYDLGKALSRTNSIEVMRRMGMSDEQIKENLAQ